MYVQVTKLTTALITITYSIHQYLLNNNMYLYRLCIPELHIKLLQSKENICRLGQVFLTSTKEHLKTAGVGFLGTPDALPVDIQN